ncbi:MAG: glycosyltransferase family 4 protein [Coriobacteriia bacterium]|nr:glycosyltransferase family 4 protein [Coriobacteriia bacterium]
MGEILDPEFSSAEGFGGIQVQMAYLVRELLKTGKYRIAVISNESFSYPGIEFRPSPRLIRRGIPIISRWINTYQKKRVFRADTPRRIFLQSHIRDGSAADSAIAAGVEVVFRVNGDGLVDGSMLTLQSYLDLLHTYLPKFSAVICQSEHQQRLIKERWDIDASIVTMGTDAIPPTENKNSLLWVGRCVPLKQPWLFLDIARSLPEHRCHMVLSTPHWTDAEFANVIEANAATIPNLTIERNVSYSDMAERYAGALAFVSTSLVEGAPNVFAEAGMAATPVFSLAVNPANMLDDEHLGVCAQGNLTHLIELLRRYLMALPDEQAARQKQAQDFAQSQWSVDKMVASYRRVFEHDMVSEHDA